jgi:hypothetical protein
MTKFYPQFRNFTDGRPTVGAAIARPRQDADHASSLMPLVPIILLTLAMLGVVIRPIW